MAQNFNWDAIKQSGLNDALSRAVRNGTVSDVNDALRKGADARAWDCYLLTVALGKLAYDNDAAKVVILCDAMFGPAAYPALVALQAMGCATHEITKMMRAQFANPSKLPHESVLVPGDFI